MNKFTLKNARACSVLSRKFRGSGLIEVMVAVLVIAVGVTSSLQMFAVSAKNARYANYRLQAQFLINDLFKRIKENRYLADNGSYTYNCQSGATAIVDPGKPVYDDNVLIVSNDLTEWKTKVDNALANAQCSISFDAALKQYTANIAWHEDGTTPTFSSAGIDCNTATSGTVCFSIKTQVSRSLETACGC